MTSLDGKQSRASLPGASSQSTEELLRVLAETAPDVIYYKYRVYPESGFEYVSPTATQVVGYTPEEYYADPHLGDKLVHPDDRQIYESTMRGDYVDGSPLSLRWMSRAGKVVWLEQRSKKIRDATGRILAIEGTARDITRQKESELVLRLQAQIAGHISEGVCLVRAKDGVIVYANPVFETLFGYERGELCNQDVAVVNAPTEKSPEETSQEIQSALRRDGVWRGEVLNRKKNGEAFWCYASVSGFEHPEHGLVWVAVHSDITHRKNLESRLRIADRMTALGALAAGVAHEINNPLSYLISNVEHIHQELIALERESSERFEDLRQSAADARHGAERVRRVVKDLRAFSRSDEEEQVPVDIHQVLSLSINIVWNEIRHRARLTRDFGHVPLVRGSEGRLGQVFVNVLLNAAQAIPLGDVQHNEIRVTTRRLEANQVLVEVRDTGCGIRPEHLARIFEPFFTTKPAGVGTGLGLSICHGIVKTLGGEIEVESEIDRGTSVRIRLCVSEAPAVRVEPRTIPAGSCRRGKILVIDDEPLLGSALRRGLHSEHEVVVVQFGKDAVEKIRNGEHFDVIVTDLMMPEMNGMQLYSEVAHIAPSMAQRIIFMTGGAFAQSAQEFLEHVSLPSIEKPIDMPALRTLIRERLS